MNRRKQKYIQMRYLIKDLKFYITIPYKVMNPFLMKRIWMPKNHPLVKSKEIFDSHIQLFKFLQNFDFSVEKNFIDIGANIGDTTMVISKANNNLNQVIAVEPSWYFYIYLLLNVRKLNNIYTINKYIKGATLPPKVKLRHWGGTAYLSVSNWRKINSFKFEELHRIANERTVFIKLDTDGQDIEILIHSIPHLVSKPIIWYENYIYSQEAIRKTLKLFNLAKKYGYAKIIIFSDKGKLIYIGSLQNFTKLEIKLIIKKEQNGNHSNLPYFDVVIIPKTLNTSIKVLKNIF